MLWGIIHSNSSLFLLRHLQTLILSLDNDFRGSTIPPEFGTLTDLLHLEVWSANFAGDIPLEISYLSKLQTLEVYSGNQQLRLNTSTSKRIVTNLTNLQNLTLADVDMSRIDLCFFDEFVIFFDIPLLFYCGLQGNSPNTIFHLPKLEILYLNSLPKYNWSYSLRILDLSGTNFSIDILDPTRNLKSLDGLYLSNCSSIYSKHSANHSILPNLYSLYYLNLSHNFLTNIERIPWKNLQFLDLHSNILHRHLPIPPPSVEVFSISHNQLMGEVPSLICNLSSLEVLDLANNGLSGKLPPCIGNLSGSLSVLDIRMNKFHGTIPRKVFAKENILRNLNLNGNEFEGSLPRSLLNCKKLEVLDIGNNHINGMFPHWLESLPMLQVLILRSNKFYGSIANPMARFPFRKLRILDLANNEFSGKLPVKYFGSLMAMMEANTTKLEYMGENYYQDSVSVEMKGIFIELVKIQTIFTTIDLFRNNFEGEILKLLGNLRSLKGLNFSHNKLMGSIPPSFANLSGLEWLDLSSNQFVGGIPQQLANRLVGPIPRGNHFETFDSTSNIDEAHQEGDVHEQTNEFDLWKIVVMGYGCGVVIEISIGYMVLSDRRIALFLGKLGGDRWIQRIRW
ncbi:receptor-like protein 32 [Ziziphus jujuba]|uniref:Receptor-like protein 32 n=1 Tax=Ziziphus jujuba TaxID=326968 RepID=A0ABM3ZRW1_ZIZJJ|nr:receptor-like protein 32 [Ziziphus jujuba]